MTGQTGKVVAYITNGRRLLVFRHKAYPEAGIQVPAGTIELGELPESAVLREVFEESGLKKLELAAYLGQTQHHNPSLQGDRLMVRHYFHLLHRGPVMESWRHWEQDPAQGEPDVYEFELYWVNAPGDIPQLAGGLGALLAEIDWDSLPA